MNNKSSICLNMIVKNEKHIIKETLDNLTKYINFNYWIISDTGSTDGTQEFIKEYFIKKIFLENYFRMNGKILPIIEIEQ
jgi:glycosyltransferase involved in cell wall biosynthesis